MTVLVAPAAHVKVPVWAGMCAVCSSCCVQRKCLGADGNSGVVNKAICGVRSSKQGCRVEVWGA